MILGNTSLIRGVSVEPD